MYNIDEYRNIKVYLATPYTHKSRFIRWLRFRKANKAAGQLMEQGFFVYSPISHTHPICVANKLPFDFSFWSAYDRSFIDWCDVLVVNAVKGWKESKGVTAEIEYANAKGKPLIVTKSLGTVISKIEIMKALENYTNSVRGKTVKG